LIDTAPGALAAFAPAGHDVAVIHSGTLTVYRDVTGAATRRELPVASSASAVAFSADGRTVFIARERARSVSVIDIESGSITPLACDCAPTALAPMGALFRLNELTDSPLWLLDASASPRLVFVPAKSGL
jgi:DNA-binding beta-propeller fold protein YncE